MMACDALDSVTASSVMAASASRTTCPALDSVSAPRVALSVPLIVPPGATGAAVGSRMTTFLGVAWVV